MLNLLRSPSWALPGAPVQPLPATVPGGMLVYLAAQGAAEGAAHGVAHGGDHGAWFSREQLMALFWPDRPAAEGQHNLRVNLHRLRQLLHRFGQVASLTTERSRLRLSLPTDVAAMHQALAWGDPHNVWQHRPTAPLQGLCLGGFEAFNEWADLQRERWLQGWLAGCDQALVDGLLRGAEPEVRRLFQAWQEAGGEQLPALRALDPTRLSQEAQACWRHVCARLPQPPARGTATGIGAGASRPAPATRAGLEAGHAPLPLPGRGAEQDALRASAMPALVVLGEPGAGKSSLLRSCWPGAPWLQGREGLEGVPYAPLLEWLNGHDALLRRLLQAPASTLAAYRLDLARLLPELAPDEPLPPLDALTAKARLFEALARVFETQGPVLLVDDLQWFDHATLEWLVFVAHRQQQRWRASTRPLALAGLARQALASLQAARLLQRQDLPPLSPAALAESCRQRWPHLAWTESILQALHRACAGNPFVLGELVAQGAVAHLAAAKSVPLPSRVLDLVGQRLRVQGDAVQALVAAAAVLGRPAPLPLLLALCDGVDDGQAWPACAQALEAGLLREEGADLQCKHDLIRAAALAGLGPSRLRWLHRRAALALGGEPEAEAQIVASHWEAADELPNALAWLHRAARQQKLRGRFDEARSLWQRVAGESRDSTLVLRAQLALAECNLFDDLKAGRQALEQVLAEAGAVADAAQRVQIEGQALAGLVDNAVFSGDLRRAGQLAGRLRPLLPQLGLDQRVNACEVLIELAMREPDIPAAWALLDQVRRMAPRHPAVLSYAGQIHWFAGDARAALQALEQLLQRHPEYCSGLTIENDLAVMLSALGELAGAQAMARRSLISWRGVAHTETLSLLVLGMVLVSAGQHGEARATLDRAAAMGREQGSVLFEAEALCRRARLWLQCARWDQARADLDTAEALLRDSSDPLRVSQYALLRAQLQWAEQEPVDPQLAERLRPLSLRSLHPLLHGRLARIGALAAIQAEQWPLAAQAAARSADIARGAGLLEPLAEALLLSAYVAHQHPPSAPQASAWLHEAAALAEAQGFLHLAWRAARAFSRLQPLPERIDAERRAVERLRDADRADLFDQEAAQRQPL